MPEGSGLVQFGGVLLEDKNRGVDGMGTTAAVALFWMMITCSLPTTL